MVMQMLFGYYIVFSLNVRSQQFTRLYQAPKKTITWDQNYLILT